MEKHFVVITFLLFSLFYNLVACSSYEGELRVGNPDNTDNIERPCPTYDLNCIRVFFETHAHCRKTFGPVPDPLFRTSVSFYVPRVNLSVIADQQLVNNLNRGRVEEFFVNRDTGNLVIAVQFRNMTQIFPNNNFIFHRRAKEPVVTAAFATVTYTDLVITCVIPKIKDLRLQDAECTTFSNGLVTQMFMSPSIAESTDPQVQETVTAFLANVPSNIQELFLTDSAPLITSFIQYNICDFGILVT